MTTEFLSKLIDAKLQVLTRLLALARRQLVVIASEDLASLLTLLAGKQQLVSQLQAVDRQLTPFNKQDAALRNWPTPEARTRCQQQAARCEAVLREVLAVEQQAEQQMTQRRDETAHRLSEINRSHHVQRAYVAAPAVVASTLDLTSEG